MIAPALAAALFFAAPLPAPAPPPDPDEEIVAHLEELERLDLLRNLELFDPGEEEEAPAKTPPPGPPAPEP